MQIDRNFPYAAYAMAVLLVAGAAALRLWPLHSLGLRIPYVTFYPAVIAVGLYGGLSAGLLTTVLAAMTILFWSPTGEPFIKDSGDWLGMAVFCVNCVMISFMAEAMLRAQARARKAQAAAEAANQAKSVFLATMSHELRTPLSAILGFSDLMRTDQSLGPLQRENLDIIQRSGEHLLNLINDVLDMAKIDAGRTTASVRPFDLSALLRDSIDMLDIRAREKNVLLRLEQSAEVPRFIRGDEAKLRQVLVNLVSNAVKYTPHGTVTVRLRAQAEGDAWRLILEVEDTGVGISKADQARIFEPFVQVGNAGTQKGTGLGLAIVREYVTVMGGQVELDSTPGIGTLFRVELPVSAAEESEIRPGEPAHGEVTGLAPGQPAYRVLVVDDQPENALLLQRLLETVGFSVEVAENGALGVDRFKSFRPHFIWMDRRMPVMDGIEATQYIRSLSGGQEVRIAAVTASAFDEQRADLLAAGMDDFIRKPFHPAEIFECMARHLGVRYVYRALGTARAKTEARDPALLRSALAGLPESLRGELADALVRGKLQQLAALGGRIEQLDPGLARILAPYLDDFDYLPILHALEHAKEQPMEGFA